MKRIFLYILFTAATAAVLLNGCGNLLTEPPGLLEFPDYVNQHTIVGGNAGMMEFGGKTVELGARAVLPVTLKNSGTGSLTISNMSIVQETVPEDNPADALDAFRFIDESFPALPLIIPAGVTVNDIFVEFAPETAGDFSGRLFIETGDDSYYIDMTGTGLWQLTLNGSDDGKLYILAEDGNDTLIDGSAESGIATSSDGIFNILCEPDFLRQMEQWQTFSGTVEYDNIKSEKTTIILSDHSVIGANILNPYVLVPDDTPDLQTAINQCNSDPSKIAVIVSAGTHTVGNVNFLADIPVYGGYSGFTVGDSRAYKTVADRNNSTYQTILNVGGTINISGSGLKNNVVLEGFTINKSGGADAPLIRFDYGTTAELRYNTITSGGSDSSAAVFCTNSAAPLIKYNYINGGNTSANYSESYGIKVTEKAAPVIYKNSITGGTANGTDSISFGIYCDFETEPYICNNTPLGGESWGIAGGSAPGSGGQSYGIYIINNGNAQVYYNLIDGGSGKTAVGLFAKYGGYIDAGHNNIFTSGGSTRIALWADHMGRIYYLKYNGIYDCGTALYRESNSGDLKNIDAVNNEFNTSTNKAEAVDLSGAPAEVEYE